MPSNWLVHSVDNTSGVVMTQRNKIWVPDEKSIYFRLLDNKIFNAMYEDDDDADDIESGETIHWRFNCKTIAMVGLTTKKDFGKSHKLRAFALHWVGKLSDASYDPMPSEPSDFLWQGSLTTADYGLEWPPYTEIHFIAQKAPDTFKLSIIQDKRSLGLAWDLILPVRERLYPVVRFKGPGQVAVFKMDRTPNAPTSMVERDPEIFEGINVFQLIHLTYLYSDFSGEEGFWKIIQFGVQKKKTVKPYAARLFRLEDDTYDLQIKIVNNISALLNKTPYGFKLVRMRKGSNPGEPEQAHDEAQLVEFISGLTNIRFDDEETLIFDTLRGQVVLKRYIRLPPEPMRSSPLRKSDIRVIQSPPQIIFCQLV